MKSKLKTAKDQITLKLLIDLTLRIKITRLFSLNNRKIKNY